VKTQRSGVLPEAGAGHNTAMIDVHIDATRSGHNQKESQHED